jgi:anaerobic magnesium-protoporphyrin IX monomethyl ester cyclase
MAKMLMIQLQPYPYAGTAYLCGAARSAGHEFKLLISEVPEIISDTIDKEKPDLIGFSCMTGIHIKILELIKSIKRTYTIPIILGGPHPTFFPEIINSGDVDIICRGEGEFALIDLLNSIEKRIDYNKIENLWVKDGDLIHKNEMRPLAYPLDIIPMIDWSCYDGSNIKLFPAVMIPIRGCPFSCTYCFNEKYRALYSHSKKYVRHFSVQRAIAELKVTLEFFSPQSPIIFTSDSFGIDLSWMEDFFREYSKITTLPFVVLLRPELASEKCIGILKKYNCFSVAIGVESGSERVRKEILNRNYSNQDLLEVAERLHNAGLKFRTYNIIGLPTESTDEMFETIEINISMKTDYPRPSIFSPFPGTQLTKKAIEMGYLPDDFSYDNVSQGIHHDTLLKMNNKEQILNILYFFQTFILFPGTLKFSQKLIRIPPNYLFKLWFMFIYAVLSMKSEGKSLKNFVHFAWINMRYFMG